MKQGWSVLIEGRPAKPVDPEDVLEKLTAQDLHPATSFGHGLLSTTCTVDARSPMEAIDFVYEALSGALHGVKLDVELVEAMAEARQDAQLARSNAPDLVGLAEIAEIAGTTRQRVFQMTANKGFPEALIELRSGRLWSRPAIESYLESRQADRRPRVKTLTSQVGGRVAAAIQSNKLRPAARRRA